MYRKIFFIVVLILMATVAVLSRFPIKYSEFVKKAAKDYNLEPSLVYAVILTESGFNANAVSNKDARGLMQLREITAEWLSEEIGQEFKFSELYKPDVNINLGAYYLRKLTDQYGNTDTALAAYNAGSGNVSGWLKDKKYSSDGVSLDNIPFGETRRYISKVNSRRRMYSIVIKFWDIINAWRS